MYQGFKQNLGKRGHVIIYRLLLTTFEVSKTILWVTFDHFEVKNNIFWGNTNHLHKVYVNLGFINPTWIHIMGDRQILKKPIQQIIENGKVRGPVYTIKMDFC